MLASSPPLAWSSYLGGAQQDNGRGVATDSAGNVFVTGNTQSQDWVAGGFDTSPDGGDDAFVTKINADGSVAWSTYVGGQYSDVGYGIAVDTAGNVYVAGQTTSEAWVSGGYDTSFGGGNDAFVAKIYANGQLAWTSYLGGGGFDAASGVAVNSAGQVYISGYTDSAGWISGGYDTTYGGNDKFDAFIAKLESNGALGWSTYVGGANNDTGYGIALDPAGNVFVTGDTYSENWISGGYDTSYEGMGNAYVAKVNSNGTLAWSSYISADFWSNELGYGNSVGFSVATDSGGSAYVTGETWSTDFNSGKNAFVLKVSAGGSKQWLTYLGGSDGDESGRGIDVDAAGNAYLTGQTTSPGWVTGGFDTTFGGWDGDAFVAKLDAGGAVAWSSYLGGSGEDRGRAIAVDSSSNIYVTGYTASNDWVSGGFDTSYGSGFYDGFVAKIGSAAPVAQIVNGTAGNDGVRIQRAGSDVQVLMNGSVVWQKPVGSPLRINTLGGDDSVEVLAGVPGVYIEGGAGNDLIAGGDGADTIYGGDGNDQLSGGDGIDTIYGNFGDDVIAGGLKRDSLLGGLGNDTITAGDGPDSVYGGDGTDLLRGGKGADYIEGRGKSDTIYGGYGNDTLISGAGGDAVYGEDGDDWLYATPSTAFHDTLDGGAGTDRFEADGDDTLVSAEMNLLA